MSQIVARLNELFIADELTDNDMVNYAHTVKDKVMENARGMQQISENTAEQAMLGDFPQAMDDAIMNSSEADQNQMIQLLSDPAKNARFQKLIFEMIAGKYAGL